MITITMPLWMNYLVTFVCVSYLVTQALSAYIWWLNRKLKKMIAAAELSRLSAASGEGVAESATTRCRKCGDVVTVEIKYASAGEKS